MHTFKKAVFLVIGSLLVIFGLLGAIVFGFAQGTVLGKFIGVIVGLMTALFGLWLMRRVEKSYAKVFEALLDILLLNVP